MTTLFDLTYKLARLLKIVEEGTATGGSTTTLIDTVERTEDNDYWLGGTVFIKHDSAGAGAAPEKEYSYVTGNVSSTGVVSLRSTLTAAIAAGDEYAIAKPRYPLNQLIQAINEVLGRVDKVDITTVEIADMQTEYNLPTDLLSLKQVWIATDSDADANLWQRVYDWDMQRTAVGTADKLIFMRQMASGYAVKLVYTSTHSVLRVATDKLDESVTENHVIYNAAVACLLWRKAKVGDSDETVDDLLNYYQNKAAQMDLEYNQEIPKKTAKTINLVM